MTVAPATVGGTCAERATLLLTSAFADLSRAEAPRDARERVGVLLAVDILAPTVLPRQFLDAIAPVARLDCERLEAATTFATSLSAERTVVESSDSSAVARLLGLASMWLTHDEVDCCWVGGLGMGCDEASLLWRRRLGLTLGQSDEGIVPGEAAAFVELRRTGRTSLIATAHYVRLPAIDHPADLPLQSPLERALESVLTTSETGCSRVILDSNGYPNRKEEWQLASSRTLGRRSLSPRTEEPLLGLGDVGAATLPLLLGLEHENHEPGSSLIALAHAFSPGRAAVTLETIP